MCAHMFVCAYPALPHRLTLVLSVIATAGLLNRTRRFPLCLCSLRRVPVSLDVCVARVLFSRAVLVCREPVALTPCFPPHLSHCSSGAPSRAQALVFSSRLILTCLSRDSDNDSTLRCLFTTPGNLGSDSRLEIGSQFLVDSVNKRHLVRLGSTAESDFRRGNCSMSFQVS